MAGVELSDLSETIDKIGYIIQTHRPAEKFFERIRNIILTAKDVIALPDAELKKYAENTYYKHTIDTLEPTERLDYLRKLALTKMSGIMIHTDAINTTGFMYNILNIIEAINQLFTKLHDPVAVEQFKAQHWRTGACIDGDIDSIYQFTVSKNYTASKESFFVNFVNLLPSAVNKLRDTPYKREVNMFKKILLSNEGIKLIVNDYLTMPDVREKTRSKNGLNIPGGATADKVISQTLDYVLELAVYPTLNINGVEFMLCRNRDNVTYEDGDELKRNILATQLEIIFLDYRLNPKILKNFFKIYNSFEVTLHANHAVKKGVELMADDVSVRCTDDSIVQLFDTYSVTFYNEAMGVGKDGAGAGAGGKRKNRRETKKTRRNRRRYSRKN